MVLNIQIKQTGQKRMIGDHSIEIEDLPEPKTIKDLLSALIVQQVGLLHQKQEATIIQGILKKEDIEAAVPSGKVGFGNVYNLQKQDEQKAIATALQAFEDGLFALFIDDVQYEQPNVSVELHERSIITFVRLVFLAGSFW